MHIGVLHNMTAFLLDPSLNTFPILFLLCIPLRNVYRSGECTCYSPIQGLNTIYSEVKKIMAVHSPVVYHLKLIFSRCSWSFLHVFYSISNTFVSPIVENESHCDFVKLREMLIRVNMEDLREQTHTRHYELYRRCKLEEMGFKDTDPDNQPFR